VMEPKAELPPDSSVEEILHLMASGGLDRLMGTLRSHYPDLRDEVEDAVYEAISRLFRHKPVQHPSAWIYKVASNYIVHKFRDRTPYLNVEPATGGEDPAEVVQGRQALALIKKIVERWENAHVRVVTMLYIEAAWLGEPLSLLEARENAASILGEDLSIGSIGTWKARGFDRLVEELTKLDYHIKREKEGDK
jgi:DNA-directed RNA polymerase specialized sigma24 family protein